MFRRTLETNDRKIKVEIPILIKDDYRLNLNGKEVAMPKDYPTSMYQVDLLKHLSALKGTDSKLNRIEELMEYNDWHFDPLLHVSKISKHNRLSKEAFPSKYYSIISITTNTSNKPIDWEQGIFESSDSYRTHLKRIIQILNFQALVVKSDSTDLIVNHRQDVITLLQKYINNHEPRKRTIRIKEVALTFMNCYSVNVSKVYGPETSLFFFRNGVTRDLKKTTIEEYLRPGDLNGINEIPELREELLKLL